MKREVYFSSLKELCAKVLKLAASKGAQYWSAGPFEAFERASIMTGQPREAVLFTYASKHLLTLGATFSGRIVEPPQMTQERLLDVILYCMIAYVMVGEGIPVEDERD